MPKSMVDKFIKQGLSPKEAEGKTAKIVNARKKRVKTIIGNF